MRILCLLLEVSAVQRDVLYLSVQKYCTSKLIVTDEVLVNTVAVYRIKVTACRR